MLPALGYPSEAQLRSEFERVQTALEETVSKSGNGNGGNALTSDLSMDGANITNAGIISAESMSVAGQQVIVGTPFTVATINPVISITELRLLEPAYIDQQISLLGHTINGVGGGLFYYDSTDTSSLDNSGTTVVTTGGKRWKRQDAEQATAEDFGLIDGLTDATTIMQSYADYASSTSKLFSLPVGRVRTGPITFSNAAGLTVKGGASYGTRVTPLATNTAPLFTFTIPNVSGAAISGLTVTDIEFEGEHTTQPLMYASSIFDSVLFQRIRADHFAGNAIRLESISAATPLAYNFLEGVTIDKCIFLGSNKSDAVSTAPILEVIGNANEFDIKDTKFYAQRGNASLAMDDQASLDLVNARSAIKCTGGSTRGWAIHECSFVNSMNAKVIDLSDAPFPRIYSNMFEQHGEYNAAVGDACLISLTQVGHLAQRLGGWIANNRTEVPVRFSKDVFLHDCVRVQMSNNGWLTNKVSFAGISAHNSNVSSYDDETGLGSELFRNLNVAYTGATATFTNEIAVSQRNDTDSNEESSVLAAMSWQGLLDGQDGPAQQVKSHLNNFSFDHAGNAKVDFLTAADHAEERRAMSLYRGGIVLGHSGGVPSLNGFGDSGIGSIKYDEIHDVVLIRKSTGWEALVSTGELENIINGRFDTNVSSWVSDGSGSNIVWAAGEAVLTAGVANGFVQQNIALKPNTQYTLSYKLTANTGTGFVTVHDAVSGSQLYSSTVTGVVSTTFTTSANSSFNLAIRNVSSGGITNYDDLSIIELIV
tara:strand:- start:2202 stop:4496 length:2295 start_codon:yes stop_codon:yes gene_type:complete